MKNLSLPFLAFLQATGLVVYISLVSQFFMHGEKWFGRMDHLFGPILMLLIFVLSATISALLVLGRSGYLFWGKKYKESFTLLSWTIGWGIFYIAAISALLISCR